MAINSEAFLQKESIDLIFKPSGTVINGESETGNNRSDMSTRSSNFPLRTLTCFCVLFFVIVIVHIGFDIYYHLSKESYLMNSTLDIHQPKNVYHEERHSPSSVIKETRPVMLLFLDTEKLKDHKEPAYNVNWSLEENGFIDGNISFNGPNIYIAESGIYKISVSLQMEVKQQDRGTICTLVLNSSKNQYTIPKKYNIPPNATSHYRLVMSLNLGLKLEAEQYLYISISPRNYLCPDKNTSTFFIHKL